MKKRLESICDNYIIFCIYAFFGWIYEVLVFIKISKKFINRGVLFGPFLPVYGFGVLLLLFFLRNFMNKKHTAKSILYTSLSVFTIVTFTFITYIEYKTPIIYDISTFFSMYGKYLILLNITAIVLVNVLVRKIKEIRDVNLNVILVFLIIWILTTSLEYISHFLIDVISGVKLWDYSKDFLNINSRVCFDASRNFAFLGTVLLYIVQPFIDKFLKKTSFDKKKILCLIILIPMVIDFIISVIIK